MCHFTRQQTDEQCLEGLFQLSEEIRRLQPHILKYLLRNVQKNLNLLNTNNETKTISSK